MLQLYKNVYVRIAAVAVIALAIGFAVLYKPAVAQDSNPVIHSQNISDITALAANKDRLEYVLLANPLADFPRYVFKYTNETGIHAVKVPSISHVNLEREVLLKNAIPYAIASDEYLARHKAVLDDERQRNGALESIESFLLRNALGIVMLILLAVVAKKGLPTMGGVSLLKPESLKGSMADLIGMEDIKQEVAHLEEMIRNRSVYRSHNIDKPFNVMLTGPAGTGKTKLAGYLAKQLDMPLISA